MDCKICKDNNENKNPNAMRNLDNDCVLSFLNKIRDHYINFKSKLNNNEELTKKLQNSNIHLEEKVKRLQNELDLTLKAKRRKTDFLNESELNVSEKFTYDLNIALNTERQLENSFSSPAQQQFLPNKIKVSPQDIKTPVKSFAIKRKSLSVIKASKSKGNRETSLSWCKNKIATNIEIESDSEDEHFNDIFQTAQTEDKKTSKLKAASKKLVQSRLDFRMKKKDADDNSDETFCEEVIGASPTKNSKTLRQITLRQNCSTNNKFNIGSKCQLPSNVCAAETQLITKKSSPMQDQTCDFVNNDNFDSSSVIILPTQEEEIISLNDDTEGINMESAFLFHDILNEKENKLSYLQKLEADRIEQLQNRHRLHMNQGTKDLIKNEALASKKTAPVPLKSKTPTKLELNGISQIDCIECQSYFKYLRKAMGGKLTNEEINERLSNCTKHNGPTDINPTPEGFWDPFIQPFALNDPRNETLIDARFRNRKT